MSAEPYSEADIGALRDHGCTPDAMLAKTGVNLRWLATLDAAVAERDEAVEKVDSLRRAQTCVTCGGLICPPMQCAPCIDKDEGHLARSRAVAAEAERDRLRVIVDRIHEAIGEGAESDDESLPDVIATHIRESREVAVDAEADRDRLRGLLREAEAVCVMYHPDDTDATKHNLSVLRDRIAAALDGGDDER